MGRIDMADESRPTREGRLLVIAERALSLNDRLLAAPGCECGHAEYGHVLNASGRGPCLLITCRCRKFRARA